MCDLRDFGGLESGATYAPHTTSPFTTMSIKRHSLLQIYSSPRDPPLPPAGGPEP